MSPLKWIALFVVLLTTSASLVFAQFTKSSKLANEKIWKEGWQKGADKFQQTLKTMNLRAAAEPAKECIGASVWQWAMGGRDRGPIKVLAPVPRAQIRAVKAFARDSVAGAPWWQCPFELGKQCGQITASNNPSSAVKPGGIAWLPFELQDLDDNKTMVTAEVLGWAGIARDIRLEVDYVIP